MISFSELLVSQVGSNIEEGKAFFHDFSELLYHIITKIKSMCKKGQYISYKQTQKQSFTYQSLELTLFSNSFEDLVNDQ